MAYSVLPTKNTGDPITLTNWNNIRDNFIAGVPDLYTTKGDLAPATGSEAAARLAVGADDSILVADSAETTGMRWQGQPVAIVKRTAIQDPALDSWVTINWDAEDADTDGMHSTVTNNSRLTVPSAGAGYYIVSANIFFDTSATTAGASGHYGVRILYNGTTMTRVVFDEAEMASKDLVMQVSGVLGLNAADFIQCQVWTSRDVDVLTESRFEAIWQRPL